ncbi:MAG TPA: LLM class F420-dependent oxidoreductase [Acidimicrobiales bacterium]|nr:LLM class F420-dependent oxidoreductase [Acidimicrobiales bacterium]
MRLGSGIGKGEPDKLKARARRLEDAGVDVLWVAELYGFDGVSLMGFLAAATDRVQIGSSILPFYSRTPTLLAMSAAGVDALSGGRCILGIGASGPQVIEGFHGLPYDAPVGRVGEVIDICRQVWRREATSYQGRYYQLPVPDGTGTGLGKPLKMIDHPVRDRIPVYVAAIGPKNVEMVAAKAEGWLPIFFWPEKAKEVWGPSLDAGSARRPGDLGPLEVVAGGTVAIGEGLEKLREQARPGLALYIGGMGARGRNFYNDLACRYGFEKEAAAIQDAYLDGRRDEAAALVPQELIDATTLVGPPGFVRDRIAAYREAGVTVLNVNPAGPDPAATIAQVREWLE